MLNFKRFLAPKVQTRAQARAFFLDGAAKKTSSVFPTLEFFCEILKIRFRLRNNWNKRLEVNSSTQSLVDTALTGPKLIRKNYRSSGKIGS